MTAVRSVDTAPELHLRRALYAAGIRGWHCHDKRAPGKPDLAWPA
jgi:DNA mismatch endonuclease, patch repair protein